MANRKYIRAFMKQNHLSFADAKYIVQQMELNKNKPYVENSIKNLEDLSSIDFNEAMKHAETVDVQLDEGILMSDLSPEDQNNINQLINKE